MNGQEREVLKQLVSDAKKAEYERVERMERALDAEIGIVRLPTLKGNHGGVRHNGSTRNMTTECSKCGAPFAAPSLDCTTCYMRVYNWQNRNGRQTTNIRGLIAKMREEAGNMETEAAASNPEPGTEVAEFKCDQCGYVGKTAQGVVRHKTWKHGSRGTAKLRSGEPVAKGKAAKTTQAKVGKRSGKKRPARKSVRVVRPVDNKARDAATSALNRWDHVVLAAQRVRAAEAELKLAKSELASAYNNADIN